MKLLLVVDRYAPEARSAAHLFEDLARRLVVQGHEVLVLTKQPSENVPGGRDSVPARERRDGVLVTRLSSPLGEPRWTALKAADQAFFSARVFLRLLLGARPDAVLVYTPPLPLAAAAAGAARLRGFKLIVNLHDLYPRTAIELGRLSSPALIAAARWMESFVYRSAAMLLVPAPASARYLTEEKGLPGGKVRLVYNWLDLKKTRPGVAAGGFRAKHGLQGKFVITYGGLVGVAQDLSAVIEAARLSRSDSSLAFVIMGEGSELERWRAAAKGLPGVLFLPTQPREGYLDALRSSDAGLIALSSDLRSPAIPGKLQNLMALALPVLAVVPQGCAAAETVAESGCGLLTPPGDGRALLESIERLRQDPGLRARLGDAGRRYAEERFTLERAAGVFEEAFSAAGARGR